MGGRVFATHLFLVFVKRGKMWFFVKSGGSLEPKMFNVKIGEKLVVC